VLGLFETSGNLGVGHHIDAFAAAADGMNLAENMLKTDPNNAKTGEVISANAYAYTDAKKKNEL